MRFIQNIRLTLAVRSIDRQNRELARRQARISRSRTSACEGFDTRALRKAADRLTGWTWTGDGPLDPREILRSAATEIERLQDECRKRGAALRVKAKEPTA